LADIVAVSGPLGFRTSDEFLFFAEIISALDREFLDYADEKQKRDSATKSKRK
jgi:hypothetical protein